MTDFLKALRASYRFFWRDLRHRQEKRRRANLPDPFSQSYQRDQALREAYNKPFEFKQKEKV